MNMEKRNVELTIEKAREWYQKGGELREVALQAFNEQELTVSCPKTWEEYIKTRQNVRMYYVNSDSEICPFMSPSPDAISSRNLLPTYGLANAFLAYMQLISLRKTWVGDWEPCWEDGDEEKYCIHTYNNKISVHCFFCVARSLSFPTKEMAQEFLISFNYLIETAKGLF